MNPAAALKVLALPFDRETTRVLIAGYLSHNAAHDDYRAALACGTYLHGAIVASKDLAGKVSVRQSDHMIREGAQGLGALGFLSGLLVSRRIPLATWYGAVTGGVLGEAMHLMIERKVKGQAVDTLPLGWAMLVLAYPESSARTVEPVVKRAVTKATGEASGHHIQALRGALAGAREQMFALQP